MDAFKQMIEMKCVAKAAGVLSRNASNCGFIGQVSESENCQILYKYCLNISIIATKQWISALDETKTMELDLAVPFYGYLTPMLAVLTTILNSIMIIVFSKSIHRSPTNVIISAIAVLDALTILLPLPFYVRLYTFRGFADYSPFRWCFFRRYVGQYVPTVCHSSALWLTVMLSIQRYVGITGRCKHLCTYKAVVTGMLVTFIFMALMHAILYMLEDVVETRVISKHVISASGIEYVNTCGLVPRVSADHYGHYIKTYLWIRTVFVQLLPVFMLLIFNTLLLKITCNSYRYRRKLILGNDRQSKYDLREVLRTSTMLVSLCVFALVVETPVTALLTLMLMQSFHGIKILNLHGTKVCMTVTNFVLFLSFPANFAICFGLSHKFRNTLRELVWKFKRQRISSSAHGETISMIVRSTKSSNNATNY